jgi:hypothetical protein
MARVVCVLFKPRAKRRRVGRDCLDVQTEMFRPFPLKQLLAQSSPAVAHHVERHVKDADGFECTVVSAGGHSELTPKHGAKFFGSFRIAGRQGGYLVGSFLFPNCVTATLAFEFLI